MPFEVQIGTVSLAAESDLSKLMTASCAAGVSLFSSFALALCLTPKALKLAQGDQLGTRGVLSAKATGLLSQGKDSRPFPVWRRLDNPMLVIHRK